MSTRKPGLPICQHITTGSELQQIREQLLDTLVTLGHAYPKTARQVRQAKKALDAVDELRNILDSVSSDEHSEAGWSPTVYYGANRERRAEDLTPILDRHKTGRPACCTPAGQQVPGHEALDVSR